MGIFEMLLSFGSKLLDQMPDFDQKKKDQFYNLKTQYQKEKASPNRDDDKLLNLKEELETFLEAFHKELEK